MSSSHEGGNRATVLSQIRTPRRLRKANGAGLRAGRCEVDAQVAAGAGLDQGQGANRTVGLHLYFDVSRPVD